MGDSHILVVEDDENLLRGIYDLLTLHGYEVSTAVDGADGLRVLSELPRSPDLIISDIRMPNMDGYEFLSSVRARPEWLLIPFIFLTALGQRDEVYYGRLRGVDDYIIKPFNFPDLLVSVQASLRRRAELMEWQEFGLDVLRYRVLAAFNHEFRTPLTLIMAYADLLSNSPVVQDDKDLRQYVKGILDGSDRLNELTRSFLILIELEIGYGDKIYERRQTVIRDIARLVQEVTESLSNRAQERDVVVDFEAQDKLPPILGDRTYLSVGIWHLIDNAIKFSPRDVRARVRVTVSEDNGCVVCAVSDEGPGIPLAGRERLFDVLYQIDREKNQQPGLGAGLAIVRHVARLHGGQIEVESQEGRGSCFRLCLPGIDLAQPT